MSERRGRVADLHNLLCATSDFGATSGWWLRDTPIKKSSPESLAEPRRWPGNLKEPNGVQRAHMLFLSMSAPSTVSSVFNCDTQMSRVYFVGGAWKSAIEFFFFPISSFNNALTDTLVY